MCGIFAGVAKDNIEQLLVAGLQRLEYRGYDSAGVAVVDAEKRLWRVRAEGKVSRLAESLLQEPVPGRAGVAHTRWATHGEPSERNAHPHISSNEIALVHNGIIENYVTLHKQLEKQGYQFTSDTDSEVVVHLLHACLQESGDLLQAARACAAQLRGAFALGIIHKDYPQRLVAIRHGSPLLLGYGQGEHFVASDTLALAHVAQQYSVLADGDIVDIQGEQIAIYNQQGEAVTHQPQVLTPQHTLVDKGEYQHFMLKEIYEQPQAVSDTLAGRLSEEQILIESFGRQAPAIFSKIRHVHIAACGTSYYAGLVAEHWLESLAGVSCKVQVASEFRYRSPVVPDHTLFLTISQSGETADTLAALRESKQANYVASLSICNVAQSSLVRETDLCFMTHAGPEIGVASTKAFTTQLCGLLMLALSLAKHNPPAVQALRELPSLLQQVLSLDEKIKILAQYFVDKQHALFLGRGSFYPIALEGALKLKEISYIHAEGYPAGELKHGPLALIDKHMPVIAVAPNDASLEKLKSNLQEVRARGGKLFVFAERGTQITADEGMQLIELPSAPALVAPIVYTLPLQLLAYHVAVMKGTDVDQPRNLAKSVTVE